jgi:UDP-N-acetyl-D-mannosaminuronic acid transferase (WecB/TagA/CpsF family)
MLKLNWIRTAKPNIVDFGMPLQERWLMENWDHIDANVALTGGAVFDYVSGELQRAPCWMTRYLAPTAWSGWAASSSSPAALS